MNPYSSSIHTPMNHSRPLKVTSPIRKPYISQLQTIPENDSLALFNFYYSYVSYIFNVPQFSQKACSSEEIVSKIRSPEIMTMLLQLPKAFIQLPMPL